MPIDDFDGFSPDQATRVLFMKACVVSKTYVFYWFYNVFNIQTHMVIFRKSQKTHQTNWKMIVFYNQTPQMRITKACAASSIYAFQSFSKAVEIKPDYIQPHMKLAAYWISQKKIDKALLHYQQIEAINSEYIPGLTAMAIAYDRQGNFSQAEKYYRKVLLINPEHAKSANNLAYLLSGNENTLEEAFKLAKIAKKQRPKDPDVLDTLGWIYYLKGSYRNAMSEFTDSLKIRPDNAIVCFHKGLALYQIKEFEQARVYFKKALKMDPYFKGASTAREMLN